MIDDNSKTYLRQMEADEPSKELWPKLKKGGEVYVWKKGQATPYTVKIDFARFEKSNFQELPFEVDKSYLEVLKGSFHNIPLLLKIKITADNQYFSSGEVRWDEADQRFKVNLNGPFFVTTKRSSCRYVTSATDRISVTVMGHVFSAFDISSGGFSTVVSALRYASMEKGTTLEQVELKYNLKKFTIPKITLVNVIPMKGDGALIRLAFKFEGLKVPVEDSIWVEVNKSVQRLAQLMEG
jgi:hypothetical protein